MENRSLTIMFTDIKGFTPRTSAQSREQTIDMIRQHKELLLPVATKYGGRLVKAIGDAFLLVFESPTDAVLCGMDLQNTLHRYNESRPREDRIEIRISINTGEVTIDEGDVYGEAVNIASRIEGIAEPNEVYFTEATYLSMNKSEVPSAEIGYRLLKGIPQKIKVFKVLREREKSKQSAKPHIEVGLPADEEPGRAPNWRRIAAGVVDGLLALLPALLLLAGDSTEMDARKKEIKSHADELARIGQDAGFGEKEMNDALWGDGQLDKDMPFHAEISEFRDMKRETDDRDKQHQKNTNALWMFFFMLYQFVATAWRGRSLGKKLFKLRIVRLDSSRVGWWKSALRTLLYILSGISFGIGFIWIFFDKKRQGWHDKIAETRVVFQK